MRILVGDDHPLIRKGLAQLIKEEFPQAVIGETGNGHDVLEAVRKEKWDTVILDINLPDKNGLDVLKEARVLCPQLSVLILSQYAEEEYAVRALKAGARGYLSKDAVAAELVAAIRKIRQGNRYVSASLAERLTDHLTDQPGLPLHEALSDREYQVLRLIGQGKTVTEIADRLSLSVKTVSTYRARLLEKLRIKTTASLIRYAVEHKLLE
jgi:DNA-binding NarL/FixJ family response regulator